MKLYNSIVSWIIKKRIHQIDLFINYPFEVQSELRTSLIDKAKNTEFGRKHGFKMIQSYDDFKNAIPLNHYEDLVDYITRMRSGEQNILWPSDIKWFAKSSGTTNDKSKYIPVSTESLEDCHYKGGKDLLSIYCNNYKAKNIFDGKSLMLGGTHQMSPLSNSMHEGDLSAIIMENLPFWVQLQRSPDMRIAKLSEWETKIDKMAEQAIQENISSMSGVPSWAQVFAKKVLEKTGKQNLNQVWPNFELYMHGGVSFEPYRKNFQTLFPNSINYLETYNASEGFIGIQDQPNRKDLLLMLDYGIYYEFIPLEEYGKTDCITLELDQIECNIDYVLVLSTNAGLWRYIIGDTIRFTQTKPYRFIISGRTKQYINAFGEELMVHNAEQAMQQACKLSNCEVIDFTAAPMHLKDENHAYHEWLIEFRIMPKDINHFTYQLDNALKSINSDYEAKRYNNMILKMPVVHIAKHKLFFIWMKKLGKLGGQNKVPRLSNDRKYLDQLLKINTQI